MASAEKVTETKTIVTGVTLELTEREAQAIAFVLGRIGGYYKHPLRTETDAVYRALRDDAEVRPLSVRNPFETHEFNPSTEGLNVTGWVND